jgi:hypothetical protein
MTGPPPLRSHRETVSRGSRDEQPREFEGGRRVRVVGEDGVLIEVCSPESVRRYMGAPNADVKTRKDGSIRAVHLRSQGDDRGHLGERHGRSTVTTESVRNDSGVLVGGEQNLQHKKSCNNWGNPARIAGPEGKTQ